MPFLNLNTFPTLSSPTPLSRPQSLAWAVRKLSPGKSVATSPLPIFASDKTMKNAVRNLSFGDNANETQKVSDGVISWADRVKGKRNVPCQVQVNGRVLNEQQKKEARSNEKNGFIAISDENLKMEEDSEGWETVCYSKKNRSPEKSESGKSLAGNGKVSACESKSECSVEPGKRVVAGIDGTVGDIGGKENIPPTEEVEGSVLQEDTELEELMPDEQKDRPEIGDVVKPMDDEEQIGVLSPLNGDSDVDTDVEDGLTASDVEHQKAISLAIEQEADLSMEYEKEKELFFASAIEHEEKLAKEIADQEAFVNAIKEEEEQESELQDLEQENGATVENETEKGKVRDIYIKA